MDAAEKLGEIIEKIDIYPKLPISVEELPEPRINVYLLIEDNVPKAYQINPLFKKRKMEFSNAVYHSSWVVRLRAQLQIPGIELFPYVPVEEAGGIKGYLLKVLEMSNRNNEFIPDEVIDCRVFSEAACALYKTGGEKFFPVIKSLAPKHARCTAQVFTNLNIRIEA